MRQRYLDHNTPPLPRGYTRQHNLTQDGPHHRGKTDGIDFVQGPKLADHKVDPDESSLFGIDDILSGVVSGLGINKGTHEKIANDALLEQQRIQADTAIAQQKSANMIYYIIAGGIVIIITAFIIYRKK